MRGSTLPQRHVIRRSAPSGLPGSGRASTVFAPPSAADDFDDGFDDGDTDPGVWAGHDEPVTARPPTRSAPRGTPAPWDEPRTTRVPRRDSAPQALPPPPAMTSAPRPIPRAYEAPTPAPRAPSPRAASIAAPRPPPPPAPPPVASPAAAVAAIADVAIPAELATPVYGLVRRLALQTELAAADRVLRVGLAELTDATTARSRFVGDDGAPWSLEDQGAGGPSDSVLAQIAAAGMPVCNGHILVQPIVAAGRTVALIVLERNERLTGFGLVERAIALLVARECAGLVHQLLGAHSERQREAAADARSLFRPEALESHRSRGNEGALLGLSPRWIRRAYPLACALVVIALGFAVFAEVPTYSTGPVVITVDGRDMTAPAQGTVEAIAVNPGDRVSAGQELARLYSVQEHAELEQADQEYSNALTTFLLDFDDVAKQTLAAASAKRDRSRAVVEARTVRATDDGVVSDVRVRTGQNLMPGDRILTIVPEGADPVVVALLPGQDRPRLRPGMTLQVELKGFIKPRERVTITEVGAEVLGPDDARRMLGAQFADLVGQSGAWVLVKARLPRRTFAAQHHTYHFHNGLRGTGEVRIESKPFLVTLIPAVEKVLY